MSTSLHLTSGKQSTFLRVGPAPNVLKGIKAEMKRRRLSSLDRRLRTVTSRLVAEPVNANINQGIFYPEDKLPQRVAARNFTPSKATRSRPTTGKLRLLVLLVDFADNRGTRTTKDFGDMLFSKGTYQTGSMHDFYNENSYGLTDIDGEVLGWLRLPQPYAYYVNGDNGTGPYPQNAQKMVEDALLIAAQQIDFSKFDSDGDKFLDGLFVVHAGAGAEADPNTATRAAKIWSHQSTITKPFTSNGVTAYSYLTVPEDCRVGVCCHEFGHMLGLPDLYDTTYQSEGVGAWCVMGAGSWNNGGLTPGHFCLWSKQKLNWVKPTNVKSARTLTLNAIETNKNACYRLWKKGASSKEYFLLENRQRTGFDAKLPAAGLLIWHIDDSETNNNHSGNYWVGLRQADGKRDLELGRNQGDSGDPYPGTKKNKAFDNTTNPNSTDKFGSPTGISVSAIAVQNGTVTCRVKV